MIRRRASFSATFPVQNPQINEAASPTGPALELFALVVRHPLDRSFAAPRDVRTTDFNAAAEQLDVELPAKTKTLNNVVK